MTNRATTINCELTTKPVYSFTVLQKGKGRGKTVGLQRKDLALGSVPVLLSVTDSLVPGPLPDFISQPWRKIGRRPGIIATSQTRNGGLS